MYVLSHINYLIPENIPHNWYMYLVSAGIVCIVYNKNIIGKYFQWILKFIKPDAVKLVTNEIEGKCTAELLLRKCDEIKVLGLDCEWITRDGGRKPVALLQLATSDGFCSLFQLCHFNKIPTQLFELLSNKNILKVGVAIHNDTKYLMTDYGLKCEGFLDLRYLAENVGEKPQGLAGLAKCHLGVELDKNWRIRCSNWEADVLSQKQISYAAQDAKVAVEIFHKLNKMKLYKTYGWYKCILWKKEEYWENSIKLWNQYINLNYKERGSSAPNDTKFVKLPGVNSKKIYHTLSKPHYSNIYLLAPDGQVLCTISASKSEWYLQKELADVISEDPLTIKLRFEPSARETVSNGYYTRAKQNICVVCSSENSFRRKNIIPLEYRRHFPVHMKEHSSHDVLLLCLHCHIRSNIRDQQLRERLGYMCNAPLKDKNNFKVKEIPELRRIRAAARALYLNSDVIPQNRQNELKQVICEYLNINNCEEISRDMLFELKDINCCVEKEDYVSHGQKVVEHYKSDSELNLEKFEMLWRQHFIDTMSPKYLPELWAVDHKRSCT